MLLDFSDFSAHVSQYFILKSWMPLAPGHKSNKNLLFLRVRGYFQFFLNFFFQKIVQKNPEKVGNWIDLLAPEILRIPWNGPQCTSVGDLWWKLIKGTGESENMTKVNRLEVNVRYKTSVREALGSRPKNGIKSWSLGEFGAEFKNFFHKKVGTVSALNVKVLNFTKKS